MGGARELLKIVLRRSLPRGMRHRIRKEMLTRKVMNQPPCVEGEMEALERLLESGDRVVDAGANIGVYAKELSRLVGEEGRVYSFEPVDETYDILENVVKRVELTNVSIFHMALGNRTGECTIQIPETGTFSGYYLAHILRGGERKTGRQIQVPINRLDNLLEQRTLPPIDFVKCDVEGADLELVQGSSGLITQQKAGWFIEVSRRTSVEMFEFFHLLGYEAYVWREGKFVLTKEYLDQQVSNYFFLHPDKHNIHQTNR